MQVNITEATLMEKPLMERMMELYQYDFSEFENIDLDERGLFGYKYLDLYWAEVDRHPYIIKVDNKLAGFVLVNKHAYLPYSEYSISEFFIMRKYRKQGIGKEVAIGIFKQFICNWELQVTAENKVAQIFWHKIINEYTSGTFNIYNNGYGEWNGIIFTFSNK